MIRRRNSIFIDARLLAYRRGGISRYIAALIEWLPQVAPDLDVRRVINRPTEPSMLDDIRVRTPPHFRFERSLLGLEYTIARPSVLHSPDFIAPATRGVRRIVTVHDLAFLDDPALLTHEAQRYYGQIERSVAVADRVIAVSDYTARKLAERTRVDHKKIVTIANGINYRGRTLTRDEAAIQLRSEIGDQLATTILTRWPVILVVGTIEPRKQQTVILRAISEMASTDRQLSPLVVVVGQRGWACDDIIAELEQATTSGLAIWLQAVNDQLLSALYAVATLLAMPSRDEGFGLPLLEAMAAGLPVVAANQGALPEIADGAASLVASACPSDWCEEIHSVIGDESRMSGFRIAGRDRATKFSWEKTARETAALYREVLNH